MSKQAPEEPKPRKFGRLPLGIAARLETLHGPKSVRLVDLSQGGAQIIFPGDIQVRDCVLLWLDFEAFCAAAWREGERLGLAFHEPLPVKTLAATRNIAPAIISEESLSAENAARQWVEGGLHLGADR